MVDHLRRLADALEQGGGSLAVRLVAVVPEGTASFKFTAADVPMSVGYTIVGHLELLKADAVACIFESAVAGQKNGVYVADDTPGDNS